jgi:hypothetical protein
MANCSQDSCADGKERRNRARYCPLSGQVEADVNDPFRTPHSFDAERVIATPAVVQSRHPAAVGFRMFHSYGQLLTLNTSDG